VIPTIILAVIHMDLKPENFINAKVDGDFRLKALDFGGSVQIANGKLARKELSSNARTRIYDTLITTPSYECPESMVDLEDRDGNLYVEVTTKCDIWSLGMMLLEIGLKDPRFELHGSEEAESVSF
jgi:serine/threonine protein kinase